MTTVDFNVEFELLYNNALSNSAPEINVYEKSLFLTQALVALLFYILDIKMDVLITRIYIIIYIKEKC